MKKRLLILFLCITAVLMMYCTTPRTAAGEETRVDLDLSCLSGTVVYAQVYNMMYEPEAYVNKVIRVAGYYSAYEDEETGMVYHACVIPDATACCAQGLEFVRKGDYEWPDEYPMDGVDITVTGRFEVYEEGEYLFAHLVDSELVWDEDPEDE